MKKITLNEELTRIQEMMGVTHTSPSGKVTNMSPKDDDYEINYGKDAIQELSPTDIVGSMREEETDENTEVKDKFKDQYGKEKGEEVYYATANKQDRDPETFEKNEAFDPSDSDGDGLSDCCGAPIIMHDICSECGEHCGAEEEIDENISKSTAILNRPSNRMTFEQMGMIMVLADELGGEENAKANEFVSGVVTKMKADEYIKELIAKIDNEQETPKDMPGFEGTTDALDDLGIREDVDEESAIGGWDLAMESINELQKELEEEEGSWMAMRAGKDGKVFEARGFQQETYFDTQAGALESAEEYAKHKGFMVNWESITPEHVAYESTVQYQVELLKDGTPVRKMLQISLYRMPSGKYELTNYIN
jgi:hypothetical protein